MISYVGVRAELRLQQENGRKHCRKGPFGPFLVRFKPPAQSLVLALAAAALDAFAVHALATCASFLPGVDSVHDVLLDYGGMPLSERLRLDPMGRSSMSMSRPSRAVDLAMAGRFKLHVTGYDGRLTGESVIWVDRCRGLSWLTRDNRDSITSARHLRRPGSARK